MRNIFLILCVAMCSFAARADWEVVETIVDVDTKDAKVIALYLIDSFPEIQNQLVARELTNTSKMVVNHLSGSIRVVKWKNDSNCQVPDPDKLPTIKTMDVFAGFYWLDTPGQPHGEMIRTGLLMPCGRKSKGYTQTERKHL